MFACIKKALAALGIAALAIAALAMPALAAGNTVADITLYDIDGAASSFSERYGGTRRVIIGGAACATTNNMMEQAAPLAEMEEYSDVNFMFLGETTKRSVLENLYGPYESDRFGVYYDDAEEYYEWLWDCLHAYDSSIHSIMTPFIILIGDNDRVVYATYEDADLIDCMEAYFGIPNPYVYSLDVRGFVDTEVGMDLLTLVNEARAEAGVDPLVWDADLADTAIQRVFENAALNDNGTRPDGSPIRYAWPAWSTAGAENHWVENTTYEGVHNIWLDDPDAYDRMVDPNMESFAAALYINDEGTYVWTECFSNNTGASGAGTTVAEKMTRTISVDSRLCRYYMYWGWIINLEYGDELPFSSAMVCYANLVDARVNWVSSDPSVASVTSDNVLVAHSTGEAEITGTLACAPRITDTLRVTVSAKSIASATVSLDASVCDYTGWPVCPTPTVTLAGKQLVEGRDYKIEYEDNLTPGKATVKVIGLSGYTDSAKASFEIRAIDLSSASVSVGEQVYSPDGVQPDVTVYLGSKVLDPEIDYWIEYRDNYSAGTATVVVYGKRGYTGSVSQTFEIKPRSIAGAMVGTEEKQTYTGKALTPDISVMLTAFDVLQAGVDYYVEYADNTEVGTARFTVYGVGNYSGNVSGTFKISAAHVGWYKNTDGSYVYYETNGKLRKNNWASYGGKWYYFDANGKLVANGWITYDGSYYYIRNYQPVVNGWVRYGDYWFYMNNTGNPVVNDWVQYKGTWYHFNARGICDRTY